MEEIIQLLRYIQTLTPLANQLGMVEYYRVQRDILRNVIQELMRILKDIEEKLVSYEDI